MVFESEPTKKSPDDVIYMNHESSWLVKKTQILLMARKLIPIE